MTQTCMWYSDCEGMKLQEKNLKQFQINLKTVQFQGKTTYILNCTNMD
jgi:hypothetical protein